MKSISTIYTFLLPIMILPVLLYHQYHHRIIAQTSRILFRLLCIGFINLGFTNNVSIAQTLPQPTSISQHRTFQGTIHTYPITMQLVITNNEITGYYYYDRVGDPLNLQGSLRNDGTIHLEVTSPDDYEKTIESFVGRFSAANTIAGTWVMLKNNKKLSFLVNESAQSSASISVKNYEFERCFEREEETNQNVCVNVTMSLPEARSQNALFNRNLEKVVNGLLCATSGLQRQECINKSVSDVSESWAGDQLGYTITYNPVVNQAGIFSAIVDKTVEWYSPRPNSESEIRFLNYSVKTGTLITSRDLFLPGAMPFIENLIKRKINTYLKQYEGEEDPAETTYGDLDKLNFDTSFSISPKALIYHYPYYHRFGNGHAEITLPYDEIKRWINLNGPLGFVK